MLISPFRVWTCLSVCGTGISSHSREQVKKLEGSSEMSALQAGKAFAIHFLRLKV